VLSAAERDLDRLHIRFVEAVYRMHDQGQITEEQRDKMLGLLERIDDYDVSEFQKAWEAV